MSDKTYSLSLDGDLYEGEYPTRDAAIAAGCEASEPGFEFWTGFNREPAAPEECISGRDVIDVILGNEDYQVDQAEGALEASDAEVEELSRAIHDVIARWVSLNSLWPDHLCIDGIEKHTAPTEAVCLP